MLPLGAFLAVEPLTPIPSGCLCAANNSPLLGSALLNPLFSTQPLPPLVASNLRLGHPRLIPEEALAWAAWCAHRPAKLCAVIGGFGGSGAQKIISSYLTHKKSDAILF